MNFYDSERMTDLLKPHGYQLDDYEFFNAFGHGVPIYRKGQKVFMKEYMK